VKHLFHHKAEEELNSAIDYYEQCSSGLGLEFAKEIHSTINRIIHFPAAWAKFSKHTSGSFRISRENWKQLS
jgi:toxin ParE1/3/4